MKGKIRQGSNKAGRCKTIDDADSVPCVLLLEDSFLF